MEHAGIFETFVIPYVNFFIFLGILYYFGRNPLKAAAEKKKVDFEVQAKAAEEARREAEVRMKELDGRLARIDKEAADIVEKAKTEAKIAADRIKDDGARIAKHLRAEAERVGAQEARAAQERLQSQVEQALRVAMVEKAKSDLTSSSHVQLIEKDLQGLCQNT